MFPENVLDKKNKGRKYNKSGSHNTYNFFYKNIKNNSQNPPPVLKYKNKKSLYTKIR